MIDAAEPIEAVLLDFAGTLLQPGPAEDWLRAGLAAIGQDLPGGSAPGVRAREVDATGGRPGGPEPAVLEGEQARDWARRDISQAVHRRVYEGLLGPVTGPELAGALYGAATSPAYWVPYADALPVLEGLRARGTAVAVVSNVGFDLPAVLAAHGLLPLVDVVVQSWEEGAVKPDPRLFLAGCERLGVAPGRALMVGDDPRSDGGAARTGVRTLLLPATPAGGVHGLAAVLALVDAEAATG